MANDPYIARYIAEQSWSVDDQPVRRLSWATMLLGPLLLIGMVTLLTLTYVA